MTLILIDNVNCLPSSSSVFMFRFALQIPFTPHEAHESLGKIGIRLVRSAEGSGEVRYNY